MIALLTATRPVPKCIVHTDQNRSFSIAALQSDPSKPDINKISLLVDVRSNESDWDQKEVPIFQTKVTSFPPIHANSNKDETKQLSKAADEKSASYDTEATKLLQGILRMDGLRDRLYDVAMTENINEFLNDFGCIEEFLKRSETVIAELLSAIQPYMIKLQQINLKYSSISVPYLDHLLFELTILNEYEIKQRTKIIHNVNNELDCLTLVCTDEQDRDHRLKIELTSSYPNESPIYTTDLPLQIFNPEWKLPPNNRPYYNPPLPMNSNDDDSYYTDTNLSKRQKIDDGNSILFSKVKGVHELNDCYDYGLVHVFKCFESNILKLQKLWHELDDIDTNTLVLEPSLPARYSCVQRRIAIQSNISMRFEISIDHLMISNSTSPISYFRFIGPPSSTINELKDKFHKFIKENNKKSPLNQMNEKDQVFQWNKELSIRQNLINCFGPLPSPVTIEREEYVIECGICYSHRLPISNGTNSNDEHNHNSEKYFLPDESCRNPKCARSYHKSCLYEWLNSLTSTRISFDQIFGNCPYCGDPMSVQIPSNINDIYS